MPFLLETHVLKLLVCLSTGGLPNEHGGAQPVYVVSTLRADRPSMLVRGMGYVGTLRLQRWFSVR
jgi:hypothetical protein